MKFDTNPERGDEAGGAEMPELATRVYAGNGVAFRYPAYWNLSEEDNGVERTLTVQSPGTSFWMVSLFPGDLNPESLVETIVETYAEDYDDLDRYPSSVALCGQPTVACDLDFVCFDLVSSAAIRAFQTAENAVLVLYQGDDQELETTKPILEAITNSFRCDLEMPEA